MKRPIISEKQRTLILLCLLAGVISLIVAIQNNVDEHFRQVLQGR